MLPLKEIKFTGPLRVLDSQKAKVEKTSGKEGLTAILDIVSILPQWFTETSVHFFRECLVLAMKLMLLVNIYNTPQQSLHDMLHCSLTSLRLSLKLPIFGCVRPISAPR